MTVHRAFVHLAFAFLLLSQQLGMTHAISHLGADVESGSVEKKQLPSEMRCEQCLAFAALGAGLTASQSSVSHVLAPAEASLEAAPFKPLPAAARAFDSRAPPIVV